MLFDAIPAELPTATLLPGAARERHRAIGGQVRHWFIDRWTWLRPRTVPMIVAFVGMLAVLGTTKYLSTYTGPAPRRAIVIYYDDNPAPRSTSAHHRADSPGHIRIVPVRPGSHDVTITLDP